MPRKPEPEEKFLIRMNGLELWGVQLQRAERSAVSGNITTPLQFSLKLGRLGPASVGVELSVAASALQVLDLAVSYRARFDVEAQSGGAVPEDKLKEVAVRAAPAALYPFVRETIMGLLLKVGVPPMGFPLVNFAEVFRLEEIELPKGERAEP